MLNRFQEEDGSLPLALLVAIIAAGIAAALFARVVQGERTVQFDTSYSEVLPAADAGLNQALFELNAGNVPPAAGPPITFQRNIDGVVVDVEIAADPARPGVYVATSTAERDDVPRELVAVFQQNPLFFPGAFGDTFLGVNGTSTFVDSYNPRCRAGAGCGWGTEANYGTGFGSLGTNENFDFSGQPKFKPGNAFLYDTTNNPPEGTSASDPYGDRCNGNPCSDASNITTIGERKEVTTPAVYGFIEEKFENNGPCEASAVHYVNGTTWLEDGKKKDPPVVLRSFHDTSTSLPATTTTDVTDPTFTNFYCTDSIDWLRDIDLDNSVTTTNPVVIFVRDSVAISNQLNIACEDWETGLRCPTGNGAPASDNADNDILPKSQRLQIYVYGDPDGGTGGGEISIRAQTVFAGILYAPTSQCNGPNGGIDLYGSLFCGSLDNVGNWRFHYDEDLGSAGTGKLSFGRWSETADIN